VASPAPNVDYIKDFSKLLVKLSSEGYKFIVVVGGGRLAREYIAAAKQLGADENYSDEIGIAATRMNAMLLCSALGKYSFKNPCREKIFVTGGEKPGQTTDTVAAKLAIKCKADFLINATNVDGVYSEDPKKNPDAKKFDFLTTEQLLKIVTTQHRAGINAIIDPIAAQIIHKNKIKTIVINGRKLQNVENAIKGKEHGGTVIV